MHQAGRSEALLWRGQHAAAFARQLSQHQRRPGFAGLRMEHLGREPVSEFIAAAVAARRRVLPGAGAVAIRTGEADMEMVVVPPGRTNLSKPTPVGSGLAA